MLLLFALSILGKSLDYTIDFTKSDYDLFLNSRGVFIRQLKGNAESTIVYESTNVEDFTVHLNISLNFDESKDAHFLNIIVDPMKVNLDLEIKCLNQNILQPGIKVQDKSNNEDDYYNYYTIKIHSDTIFYYDMTEWSIGTIESYSLNNDLTTRVSLSEAKSFYDSYSYICYKKTDCLQKIEIGPYDSYFIAKDDTILNLYIANVFIDEYEQPFYILFEESGDFPVINERITDKGVHLMGITDKPVQLKISKDLNIDQVVITNIQFAKKNPSDALTLQFTTILIDDETPNVFPADCTITCENFYQYITKDTTQYESIEATVQKGFYILPDFETNGDITLKLSVNKIEVRNAKNELLATVPIYESYSQTAIHIEDQKNLNQNKIVIQKEFTNLAANLEDSFDINLENCGQIPIDFVNWNDEKLSGFIINIYSDLIYDEIVTNINSPYLKYTYNTEVESYFNFPEDATKVVLCLFAETCSLSEIAGNDVYQHPINGADIAAINEGISSFIQSQTKIEKLFLVLNDKFKNQELSLPAAIGNLKFLSFMYNGNDEKLPITLSAFPTNTANTKIDLEIIKCSLTISSEMQGGKLFVSEKGEIVGDKANFSPQIAEKNVDISNKDETIQLTNGNALKLIVKSGELPHNINFQSNGEFDCTIYVQYYDRNYYDIPISFPVTKSAETTNKLQIRTINHERIVFKSIPTNVETTVKFDDSDVVQYFIPTKPSKVSICYNNVLCKEEDQDLPAADEMYLSSINEKYFASLISSLKKDNSQVYEYIRLIFQNYWDYEDVDFRQIPGNLTRQIQLTSYGQLGDAYLILNSNMENKNIQSWLFEPRVFFWRSNDEKHYTFNEISYNSASEDYILEMLDNMYENYYIEAFHLQLAFASSVYNYLVDSNLILNFGKIYIDMAPDNNKQFIIKCTENNLALNGESNILNNPDLSYLYLQIPDDESNSQTIKINRHDDTIDKTNLIIAKKEGSVVIVFECTDSNAKNAFELNLYMMNNNTNVQINKNRCSNIDTYKIPYSINDIPPEINNTDNSYISSKTFEFTDKGCEYKENGETKTIESSTNRITFTQNSISILENGEANQLTEILYFVPYYEQSEININVQKTKIGVTSNKSPRVKLETNNNTLSFLNEIDNGIINILFKEIGNTKDLYFDEVNNQQGDLQLKIPSSITSVSFSDIKMAQKSSFNINNKEGENNAINLLVDDEKKINVRNSVFISPKSTSTIGNLELNGTLYIDDDSTLTLNGNTAFSEDSKIYLNATKTKKENEIIHCQNPLKTVPSSIIVSSKNDEKININDLKIIGPFNSKETCESLKDKISFKDGKKVSYSINCDGQGNNYVFSLSAKEKSKNKLGPGPIAGIVVGCVVAVAIIIGVTIYCVKRKRKNDTSTKDDDEVEDE